MLKACITRLERLGGHMSLFQKALFTVLSLATSYTSLGVAQSSCEGTNRIVCTEQLRNTSTTPFAPLDLSHAGMLSLGIFDQAQVDAMVAESIIQFRLAYGIDFDQTTNPSVIIAPGGIRVIPGLAQMIPYINNPVDQDYYVTVDTKHEKRVGKWIQVSVGQLVIFTSSGSIIDPSVPNNGAIYSLNDNWFYGYNMFLKKGANWSKSRNREIITSRSYQLGQTFQNQWNNTEIFVTLKCLDEHNNEGTCLAPTAFLRIPEGAGGTTFADNLNYYRWRKDDCAN